MFKYNLNQVVFFLNTNKVYNGFIISRHYDDSCVEDIPKVSYKTNQHLTLSEDQIFASKEELLASL